MNQCNANYIKITIKLNPQIRAPPIRAITCVSPKSNGILSIFHTKVNELTSTRFIVTTDFQFGTSLPGAPNYLVCPLFHLPVVLYSGTTSYHNNNNNSSFIWRRMDDVRGALVLGLMLS